MSKFKQMQLDIAHLIDNLADQEELVRIFTEVKTGGASAMLRNKTAQTIIDLKRIYGKNLDEAVGILVSGEQNKLTDGENVPTTEGDGK